jgi:hypothetical protein
LFHLPHNHGWFASCARSQAVLAGLRWRRIVSRRRRDFARPLGVELVRVFAKWAGPPIVPALAEDHGQHAKRLRVLRLFLAHLEQHPLRGVQVPLKEESPSQFDFLGDIGVRCDQRTHSTRLTFTSRLTTARASGIARQTPAGTRRLLTLGELHPRIDVLALRATGFHGDFPP